MSRSAVEPAIAARLVKAPARVTACYAGVPGPSVPGQRVVIATPGHRGSSLDAALNGGQIPAIAQAICLSSEPHRIDVPNGGDSHGR